MRPDRAEPPVSTGRVDQSSTSAQEIPESTLQPSTFSTGTILSDRLRVAYILPSLRKRAGWRTHARGLLNALTPFVQPVLFVSQVDYQEAQALFPGMQVVPLPATQPPLLSSRTGSRLLLRTWWAIQRGHFGEFELVHSLEAYPCGLVGHWLARKLNCAHILTSHGTYGIAAHAHPLDRAVYARVLRAAAVICPVSQGTAMQMRHYFGAALAHARVELVLNGNEFWQHVEREAALRHEAPTVPILLSVGDVKPRKGQLASLKAFQKVKAVYPQARYWIVGDPHPSSPYYQELQAFIRANHIQDVNFLGYISDEELDRCYRQATLFILTPRQEGLSFEGFGLAYLEAGAYGLPVVATRTGGVPEAVHAGETGLLAQEDDVDGIAQAVVQLLGDPDLRQRMGNANRLWAETLTWERAARQTVAIYRSVGQAVSLSKGERTARPTGANVGQAVSWSAGERTARLAGAKQPVSLSIAIVAPTQIPARRANTVQVMKMAQALALSGHRIQLAVPCNPGFSPPAWDELATHYGLQTSFPIKWLPARPHLKRYDYSLAALRWARHLHADLLYTRLIQSAAIASLLGMPTLLEVHDLPSGWMGPFFFRLFLHGRGRRRLAVITRALAEALQCKYNPPQVAPAGTDFTIIVPDGVDLERYTNLPSPAEARQKLIETGLQTLRSTTFTAGYTGHLYAGRGADLLLELAGRLPNMQFLIVGGEPGDVARIRKQADQRALHNLVVTGFIPNALLPLYQAACDVLLMPYGLKVSASSGGDIARYFSPMKLFEYLACQRPILATDLPVLHEVLTVHNAMLLPADDVSAWEQALSRLLEQPQLAAQLAARARLDAEQYTWEKRATRLLAGLELSKKQ